MLTSAGLAAGLDLCLHVVRRDYGADVAAAVARYLVVAPHRAGGQAQFIDLPIERGTGRVAAGAAPGVALGLEATRAWALAALHARPEAPLTVAAMARRAGASARHFSRRFRAETGMAPLAWLLAQRVLVARRLLETTDWPIDRIAARAGLGSAASLRVQFRRATGTTPLAYRRAFRGGD